MQGNFLTSDANMKAFKGCQRVRKWISTEIKEIKKRDVDKLECSLLFCNATFTLGYKITADEIRGSTGFCVKIPGKPKNISNYGNSEKVD